jgi:hypothetical protein
MSPSVALARAEGDKQRAIAAAATLSNVRDRALAAAAAWDKEAALALARDAKTIATATARTTAADLLPTDHDRMMSENPDRGFADSDGDLDRELDETLFSER